MLREVAKATLAYAGNGFEYAKLPRPRGAWLFEY